MLSENARFLQYVSDPGEIDVAPESPRQFADMFFGAEALLDAEHRAGVVEVIVSRGKANDIGARPVIVGGNNSRYGCADSAMFAWLGVAVVVQATPSLLLLRKRPG